jgi:hypothetical protein
MDLIGGVSARYCARQDAHAFMWLWALLLTCCAIALGLQGRRQRFVRGLLWIFAAGTVAIGVAISYGCYRWAPYSMGLGTPEISAPALDTLRCLSQNTVPNAITWASIAFACTAAAGLVTWAISRKPAIVVRIACYLGAIVLLLTTAVSIFFLFFSFAWCSSQRLF